MRAYAETEGKREADMKVFALSVAIALVLAVVAAIMLDRQQITVADTFATEGARVGDPGSNLVQWR
jgi:hypothetical protein